MQYPRITKGTIRMVNKDKADKQAKECLTSEHHNTTKAEMPEVDFPIIGIGASAGGLEALELFLGNVPEKSGMAFIVVQHLDPTRKGIMVELLKRVTAMQVFQVQKNTSVQPDCVYIIPPNKDMSLFHGVLHLFEPAAPRGLRLPIDYLFRSMADDRQERAIGVILSGMGTDGTLGLKAIKEKGGVVCVQEPASAKFDAGVGARMFHRRGSLTPELQKKLLALFHHSLNSGGILFLGSAETVGILTDVFEPLTAKSRIYRRLESAQQTELLLQFPSPGFRALPSLPYADMAHQKVWKHAPNLEDLANQLLLQHYSPAAVLINERGDILYTSGKAGKYLEMTAGKANWNIFAMVHPGLRYKLTNSFQKAVRQNSTVALKNVNIDINGEKQTVDVTIQPLTEPEALRRLVMIVITEVRMQSEKKVPGRNKRVPAHRNLVPELKSELELALKELRTARQEMQSSQEELLSAYEELQSTNEELQSTNEEITTSKEELQSLNEELQTVNYELQTKLDELSRVNNDMKNLLESTDIATLFLDNALCVRLFTETPEVL